MATITLGNSYRFKDYNNKIIFTFNYKSDTKEVTFKELNSSDIKSPTAP